jgi:hypothetical protein
VHDCVDQDTVTLNAIIYSEWKATDEMPSHIVFDSLSGFRIGKDVLYTCFDSFDEGFGQGPG